MEQEEMPTTQLEAMPANAPAPDEQPTHDHDEPSPRSVAYAVEHSTDEDPLTDHLTVLLVPAALIGLLLVTVQKTDYYQFIWYATYAALVLLSIGQGLKRDVKWSIVATSTAIAGGLTGFVDALYTLISLKEPVLLFGLVTKPLFYGLLLGLCTGFIYLLLLLVLQYKERQKNKA